MSRPARVAARYSVMRRRDVKVRPPGADPDQDYKEGGRFLKGTHDIDKVKNSYFCIVLFKVFIYVHVTFQSRTEQKNNFILCT